MAEVSLTKARRNFDEIALRVENGEIITITRYGKPSFDMRPIIDEKSKAQTGHNFEKPLPVKR